MAFSLGDSEVSLFLTGTWKGDLSGNLGYFSSPLGSGFFSPETPLLFKQEVDLTLSLWINDRWFVEANFQDEYALNTYRAGYQGLPGEFLQYAGVGNTGLDFPSFPYLDLGGDSASSFGFYSRFGNNDLIFHALLRYDSASKEERVFSGGRERTFTDVDVQNFLRGVSFVLPDDNIDSDIIVYIEDEKGGILDINGRRWRLAFPSEYAASRDLGLLELSIVTQKMIAVSYRKNGDRPWDNSMGSGYTDPNPQKFLHIVQNLFGSNIVLGDYFQCGGQGDSRPGEVTIGGVQALVIYEPGTFSPFERLNRYNAPSSLTERASLILISTGTLINGYELIKLENTSSAVTSRIDNYELLNTDFINRRDVGTLWPLAGIYPQIYLPPRKIFSGDITLRFTNYNNTSGYFIGTDVIPGSVQVWRSGIQDSNFSFNQSSGEVILNGSVGQNELIRITYLKRNEGTQFGSLAAGVGVVYQNDVNPFSAQAAVGIRWNLADDSYTDEYNSSEGTVGISAKTAWDYDFLKAHIAGGFTFVQTDTTGLYRAAGMEGNETIINLPHESSFLSHPPVSDILTGQGLSTSNRADLIYKSYFNNTILGNNLMNIEWNAPLVPGINKPYPVNDSNLNSRILAAEFKLTNEEKWTGFQVPLNAYSENISLAREIDIPFRFYGFNVDPSSDIKLVIQIGSLSGKDYSFAENIYLIWEKDIFTDNSDADYFTDGNYTIARFKISDEDRLELANAKYLRLIVVYEGSDEITGSVLLAPPIVRGAAFRPITAQLNSNDTFTIIENLNKVSAVEYMETGVGSLSSAYPDIIKRFHSSINNQRVLKIELNDFNAVEDEGISAGVEGRVNEMPLANYRELSFFMKIDDASLGQNNETLSFIITTGAESINNNQLHVRIPLNSLASRAGLWSKITIRYQGDEKEVFLNGNKIPGAYVNYNPNSLFLDNSVRRTSYVAILFNPQDSLVLPNGIIYIDEIILEDAVMIYRFNAGAAAQYSRPGTLISIGNLPVLADFSVSAAFESEAHSQSAVEDSRIYGSIVSRSGIRFSLFDTRMTGNFSFTAAQDTFLWSADHSLSRRFGAFSVRENFYASPLIFSARHGFNMSFTSDFFANFDADALYDFSRLRQRWNVGTGYRSQFNYIPSLNITGEAVWTKKEEINENESYGELWLRSWVPLVPDKGSGADSRRTQSQIILTQRTKPVGAVLTFSGGTNFTGANNTTNSDSSAFIDIPVLLNDINLNFRLGRGFKRHIYFSGNDVLDDADKYFESLNAFFTFWDIFPIYTFFAPELNDKMDKLQNDSSSVFYTSFNERLGISIILPSIYNLTAFLIPSRVNFNIERVMEQKMDTRTDTLNLSSSLGFSAINMFGVMGYAPLFNFYQTDEYSHVIEAAVSIPRGEEINWRVQSVLNTGFRGFTGGVLNFINTLTIRSNDYWTESFIISWEAPTENSLTSLFYNWAISSVEQQGSWLKYSSILNSEYEQLRRETLELIIDKSGDYLRWSAAIGHEEIVRILGRLNFTTFIKLRLNNDLQTEIFSFDAQIGTTLRFIF